jgi:PAS domain S-box-containing protein
MNLSTDEYDLPPRIAQLVSECTLYTDTELRCLTWDKRCELIIGPSKEAAIGEFFPGLLTGVDPEDFENKLRQAALTGSNASIIQPTSELRFRTLQMFVEGQESNFVIHLKELSESTTKSDSTVSTGFSDLFKESSAISYLASIDEGLKATFVTPGVEDVFGMDIGNSRLSREIIEQSIHADDVDKARQGFSDALKHLHSFSMDYRIVLEDGSIRWYHEEAMPVNIQNSDALHGVIFGLNSRHEKEEALKNTADHAFELLSNGITVGLCFLKGNTIRYANKAFIQLLPTGTEELRGRAFSSLVADSDVAEVNKFLSAATLNIRQHDSCEFSLSGGIGRVRMELSHTEMFDQHFIVATLEDINEHQKMERELTRLASIPDLNPGPIIELNSKDEIAYVNQATLEAFPTLPLLNTEHPLLDSIREGRKNLSRQPEQSISQEVEIGDRTYSQLLSRIPATELLRVYLTDITEQKNYEEQLAGSMQLAEKANRLKSEFLANMSHEIRTPLNIILGYTDLVKSIFDSKGDPQCDTYFSYIHHAGDQLTQTIDKIIDISRIHIEDFPLTPQVLPIPYMLEECVNGFKVLADNKKLSLTLDIEDEDFLIYADPYAVSESLTNVIGNAIKYTLEGTVSVALERSGIDALEIVVCDTGIGISDEFIPQLFVEFSQEEGGYGRPFEGTGLGLALTKKFVDASGGNISVESVKGQGTTFTMTFPIYTGTDSIMKEEEIQMNETTETNSNAVAGEQPVILIVEDDSLTQDFMKILLGKKYGKHFAASASEAYAILEVETINVILMDLSIKGNEDGITLTRAIRNHDEWRAIPIIALTAHAFARDRENALSAGCNAFFSKPFNRAELLSMIDKLIAKD